MATRKSTLFDQFLAPIFSNFLIDREALLQLRQSIDWPAAIAALTNPQVTYPDYYQSGNFHGIEGGYLTVDAAVTYDPITQYVLPPNEIWVRETVVKAIQGEPRRILDLGCGTGSTTLLLKQAFPQAEVIGLDLSPQMLVMANRKAQQAGVEITFCHGNATSTGYPSQSCDVVTASLLFHETPPTVARQILREGFRLLTPNGQAIILDGNQRTLRWADWLSNVFEEPYIQEYARDSVDAWMGAAGFETVTTEDYWWLHQLTCGQKPLTGTAPRTWSPKAVGEFPGGAIPA